MKLMNLPNEMLELIGTFLVQEADLYAFILTHPRLFDLLNSRLYRMASRRKAGRRRDPKRPTVLYWAAHNNRLETARKALQSGADINAVNDQNRTALWIAADKGHTEIARLLLASDEVDVDIEARCGYNMWNPLHIACWNNASASST